MTLNEFINKRCAELGITKTQLCERGDLVWSTLTMIAKGKAIKTVTKEKLARGLQCTIGEINKCLAENDDPRRKPSKEPSVMETVDKLEQIVAPDPGEELHLYNVRRPADEEPAEVFTEEPETDTDSMVLAVEEYKEQLRGQIIKHMMEAEPGTTVEQLWIRIGQMVAREVL